MKHLKLLLLLILLCSIFACSKDDDLEKIDGLEKIDDGNSIDIRAQPGVSDRYGIYIGIAEFAINIPLANDYHLKYLLVPAPNAKKHSKEIDTLDVIFNIQDSALIFIGLDTLVEIQHATLSEVVLPTPSEGLPIGNQISESVTIFYTTGDIIPWDDISLEPEASQITLIEEGNVAPDSTLIILEEEDVYPEDPICIGKHNQSNSYNVFACELGGGSRTLASGGWYWIRMSIGFEEGNGEVNARAQKPDITLPVTMNGDNLTMADTTIVEYNHLAGFWEVNAYYCTGILETGSYSIVGESYNKGEFVDRAVCKLIVQ